MRSTPPTVRAEWISDSSGMAMKASAKGRMKPSSICPAVGMRPTHPSVGPACTVDSDCSSACLSAISMSRISASAASTPARVTRSASAIHSMRRRRVSLRFAMRGKRCVTRSASSRNRPIDASTKMITSAATSEVRSELVR